MTYYPLTSLSLGNVISDLSFFPESLEEKEQVRNVSWKIERKAAHGQYLIGARSIQFVILCLSAGMIINFGSKKYHYPYTVGCFLFGVLVGLLDVQSEFVRDFTYVTRMNPNDMMLTFLPILVFESSFNMDAHIFYRALVPCLVLAVPGLILSTVLTAVFAKFALHSYGWSWFTAFLFGSVVSATDPVAVVALLKEMRMPHTFTILVEGESLLNDGVAIVIYEALLHQIIASSHPTILDSFIQLLKTCIGAPIFGYISGKFTEWILIKIYISPVIEMTLTLIMAYSTYFIAERFLGISAVVSVVLFGVTLNANKMCISPESESLIHTDWRLLSVYANTLIFVIVGVIVSVKLAVYFDYKDAFLVFATYAALTLFRSLMVAVFFPFLKSTGYGLTWKEGIILVWGGLRGGVGLALALMFASNPKIDKSENASKVLVQVSGIIILTLLINANTVKFIMKLIRFKEITLVHRLSMGNAIACVKEMREKSVRVCKRDWKYRRADWSWLQQRTRLYDPYKGGLYGDDPNMSSLFIPFGACDECTNSILPYRPTHHEEEELNEAARKKVLRAMKGSVWKQFRKGLIQRKGLKYLSMAVENASDTPKAYLKTEDVKKYMNMKSCSNWLESKCLMALKKLKLQKSSYDKELVELQTEHPKGFRKFCLWIYRRWWFEPLILIVVIANILEIVSHLIGLHKKKVILLSMFFVIFYILEIIIKIVTLQWHRYFNNPWNKFDFLLTLPAIIEGLIDFTMVYINGSRRGTALHTRIIIVLRILRISRALRILLIKVLSFFINHLSTDLYSKYDVGRGFLFANEAILKKINAIVDFGPSAKIPISVCEENVRQMLKILMDFEKEYASIAYALKCNRAARRILNRVKTVLERFSARSLILREDIKQLKKILFEMTKQIVCAPKTRAIIKDIPKILEQSDWIRNSGILQTLIENHVVCSFKRGEVIIEAGHSHRCIYIIASGILKIVGQNQSTSQTKLYNKLCNTDSYLVFDNPLDVEVNDYLMTAQTIGLLGYLQKTKSVTSAVCENDCELLQVDFELLKNAEKNSLLVYFMWRFVAINVAVAVLKQQPRYEDYTNDDIKLCLHRGILPSMDAVTRWTVPSMIEDMVLVQGKAKDQKSSTRFNAPAYIPSNYRNLVMLDDIKKRPSVIIILLPSPKFNLRMCQHWVKLDEMATGTLCYEHDSRITIRL